MKQQIKKAREIKKEKVESLKEKVLKAKTLAFVNYHGLSANDINTLRRKIKNAGGQFLVEKNTLVKRALDSANYELSTENQLTGPTAAIFAYEDEISPIREVANVAKATGFLKFKFGFFAQSPVDANALENLAKIPDKSVLHANLVGSLASPIYGFVNVLGANIRNLVSVLDQASKKNIA